MLRVRIFLTKNKLLKINLERTLVLKGKEAPFRVHDENIAIRLEATRGCIQ